MTKEEEAYVDKLVERMKGGNLLKAVIRRKYAEDLKTVKVSDGKFDLFFVAFDKKRQEEVDWNYFSAKGWEFEIIDLSVIGVNRPAVPIYITDSFWTCTCECLFTHHDVLTVCPICKTKSEGNTRRIANINSLTIWRLE